MFAEDFWRGLLRASPRKSAAPAVLLPTGRGSQRDCGPGTALHFLSEARVHIQQPMATPSSPYKTRAKSTIGGCSGSSRSAGPPRIDRQPIWIRCGRRWRGAREQPLKSIHSWTWPGWAETSERVKPVHGCSSISPARSTSLGLTPTAAAPTSRTRTPRPDHRAGSRCRRRPPWRFPRP